MQISPKQSCKDFEVGDEVLYVPVHAVDSETGYLSNNSVAERGIVTGVSSFNLVHVKFYVDNKKAEPGVPAETEETSQACDPRDLLIKPNQRKQGE